MANPTQTANLSANMSIPKKLPPRTNPYSINNPVMRGRLYQLLLIITVLFFAGLLFNNMMNNMQSRGIQSGFDFMIQPAGFDISESIIAFDSSESYIKAFIVGLSNTVRVAILGIILSTLFGTLLGVGRFSKNILVRGLCSIYVACFRNIPLLLQLLMWYLLLTEYLPDATQAWQFGDFYLSKVGFSFPKPIWALGHGVGLCGLIIGSMLGYYLYQKSIIKFEATGIIQPYQKHPMLLSILMILASGSLGWLLGGMPFDFDTPMMGEFAIEHGGALTPEFLTLLLGLTLYTAAFVAESVRSGIQSVSLGQSEAAKALGLSRHQEMRLVRLPQALRVIIPPLTNQYLNLTKNSSLAVAIGYPDLISIANTSINQTGRAVESIAIVMAVYLLISLVTAWLMNQYNLRAAIKER